MNKNDIKRILISLRTTENESKINSLLGKIDLITEEKLQNMIMEIGNDEESIKKYFQEKIKQDRNNEQEKHIPINEMFEYGIAENCVHLHMPVDLHEMMSKKGIKKTVDTVNLYLIDAIEKIRNLKNNGFYNFKDKKSIYMISPILIGREMRFLEELDFKTHSYSKKDLQTDSFVAEHPEAQLATYIFGSNNNIGTAEITFETINSEHWQEKRIQKIKQFAEQGISLHEDDVVK